MAIAPFVMQQIWIPRPSTMALSAAVGSGIPPNAAALFPGFIPSSAPELWRSSEHFPTSLWLPPHGERCLLGVLAKTAAEQLILGVAFYWKRHIALDSAIHGIFRERASYPWAGELRIANDRDEPALGTIVEANETAGGLYKDHRLSIDDLLAVREQLPVPIADEARFVRFDPAEEHVMPSINGFGNIRHQIDRLLNALVAYHHFNVVDQKNPRGLSIIREDLMSAFLLEETTASLDFITMNLLTRFPEKHAELEELLSLDRRFTTLIPDEKMRLLDLVSQLAHLYNQALLQTPAYELFLLSSVDVSQTAVGGG